MTKLHIKKGDNVIVLAGEDKGKTGKVLKMLIDQAVQQGENRDALKAQAMMFIQAI